VANVKARLKEVFLHGVNINVVTRGTHTTRLPSRERSPTI
jgi:hypothetical protein